MSSNNHSHILITGGAGYIGSHTVRFLQEAGLSNLIVLDNLENGHLESIASDVELVICDLRDKNAIMHLFEERKIESVIHFAGYAYVGESMGNPGKYFENNVYGGLNLLEAMVKNGCKKIVFSSTCSVYGDINSIAKLDEAIVPNPINPYAKSKFMFEELLGWYEKIYGLRYASLRYFNAAGAGYGIGERHEPETHLVPLVLRAILDGGEIKIFGDDYPTDDGSCVRDYIHVLDLADAHLKALEYIVKHNKSITVNLGSGQGHSVKELISIAQEIVGKKLNQKIVKRRDGDAACLVANNAKAKTLLDWEPKYKIEEIVASAYEWHKKGIK